MKQFQKVETGYIDPDNPDVIIPSDEFENEYETSEEKYGGLGGTLAATALAAARGATFSLSDLALTKSGLLTPEEIE